MPLPPNVPDLAALDLFLSVVQLGSVSRAASAHFVTQPSASSRLRNLERQLGITLLERSPTGSRPTPEGSVVAGWAEGVLQAAEQLATGIAALKAEATGLLRVAASFTVAEYLLPPWLENFFRNRPDDSVALEVANSTAVLERLETGTTDLGFIESPLPTPVMNEQVVAHDELITVVSPKHQWTRRKSIPLEALATTPLVLREKGSGTREALEEELLRLGFRLADLSTRLGFNVGGSSRGNERLLPHRHQPPSGPRRYRGRQPCRDRDPRTPNRAAASSSVAEALRPTAAGQQAVTATARPVA